MSRKKMHGLEEVMGQLIAAEAWRVDLAQDGLEQSGQWRCEDRLTRLWHLPRYTLPNCLPRKPTITLNTPTN